MKFVYEILEFLAEKSCVFFNKTYRFRKWLYLKVFKLKVCHFCLKEYFRGSKTYCLNCLDETL